MRFKSSSPPGGDEVGNFPVNAFLEIVQFLDLISVVKLGRSSKALYNLVFDNRLVWLKLLRNVLREEYIMPFAFPPVESMSLDEIKQSATRALRLSYSIKKHRTPSSTSFAARLHTGQDPDTDWVSHHHFLCPGGRWFVSLVELLDGFAYLMCWDLAATSEPRVEANDAPVATLQLSQPHHNFHPLYLRHQASEGGDEAVFLCSYVGNDEKVIYEVIRLSWTTPDQPPTFTRSSTITLDKIPKSDEIKDDDHLLEGDLICIRRSLNEFLLWDWRAGTWVTVHSSGGAHNIHQSFWVGSSHIYTVSFFNAVSRALPIPRMVSVTQPPEIHSLAPIILPALPVVIQVPPFSWDVLGTWKPFDHRHDTLIRVLLGEEIHVVKGDRISVHAPTTASVMSPPSRPHKRLDPLYYVPPGIVLEPTPVVRPDPLLKPLPDVGTTPEDNSSEPSRSFLALSKYSRGCEPLLIPIDIPEFEGSRYTLCGPPCTVSGTFVLRHIETGAFVIMKLEP